MNTATKRIDSLDAWLPDAMTGDDPPWLARERGEARERLRSEGVPGRRQEEWRYSNPSALLEQRFRPLKPTGIPDAGELEAHLVPGLDAWRVVLVNGRFVPKLSQLDGLPPGVEASGLHQLLRTDPQRLQSRLNGVAAAGAHLFATLNTAGLQDGFVLHLEENTRLEKPVELIHLSLGGDQPRLVQPRHLVRLETGARMTLIERYLSPEQSLYCTNNLVEIELGEGATLEHHRLQEESPNAFHLSGVYLRQSAASRYRGSNVALGAAWSRTDLKVAFDQPGGECEIDGLYLAGDDQLADFHLDLEHGVPDCSSRQHFKGLVTGKGRAVLDGRILVARDAQKTEAHLQNANLLLSRQAEVDTKPQLEIYADDVKCSHGASVGQLDPNTLFYLRSRGIPEEQARRMLCIGFAGEIIERCGPQALREYIEARVEARLG